MAGGLVLVVAVCRWSVVVVGLGRMGPLVGWTDMRVVAPASTAVTPVIGMIDAVAMLAIATGMIVVAVVELSMHGHETRGLGLIWKGVVKLVPKVQVGRGSRLLGPDHLAACMVGRKEGRALTRAETTVFMERYE